MKLRLVCLLALVTLSLTFGHRWAEATNIAAQGKTDVAARIQHVENGLLPAVLIKGQTAGMKLAERMAHYKVPGLSVAVINDGKIEWAKGYGVIAAGGAQPVTTETIFQAASISKPVAAIGVLTLVEQGKLDLDQEVNAKLKSWQVAENALTQAEKVTLRRLMTHSAGLTVHGFRGYASNEAAPTLVQLLNGEKPANSAAIRVDIAPGSKWRYSGGGYSVMQQLAIDVTGQPFPAFMRAAVFTKLGMKHSTYEQPLPAELHKQAAIGHRFFGTAVPGQWHAHPEMAAAGLWTTPSDLARFAIAVQQAYAGQTGKVIAPTMAKQLLTKHIGDWGLGFGLGGVGKTLSFSHGGSNVGYKCQLVAFAETGQGAVVMTNGDQGGRLNEEIFRAIAVAYGWPSGRPAEHVLAKVNPVVYDSYVGQYEVEPGMLIEVSAAAGKLFIQATGRPKFEILPETETEFFRLDRADMVHRFIKDAQGKVVEFVTVHNGQPGKAKKIK